MKLKIDTTYPDNKVKSIVFTSIPGANGKRTRTKVDGISSIDDIASHICFMSKIRPIGRPVKLWAQAPNKKDPTYGLTFKIAKTEVEPPNKTNSNVKQFLESDAFLDSDEESDTIETVAPVKSTPVATKQTAPATATTKGKQVAQVDSESEQESEEESDEEEVAKPVTKSASKTPAKKVAESEDENESDEEEKIIPMKPLRKRLI